jgi:hypothetical protein
MVAAERILQEHATEIRGSVSKATDALFAPKGGELARFLDDVNFPARTGAGALIGRETYQILFDRKLGKPDESGDDGDKQDIVNWLYCEWSATKLDEGDRFLIASGTITTDLKVEVSVAALAEVVDAKQVVFSRAGLIVRAGGKFRKQSDGDLDEVELVSKLASFRSSVVNGATIYSQDLDEE